MGLLVSGGSMATLTALAVARHVKSGVDVRADGLVNASHAFAFYVTSETHGCVRKAIELLGFGTAAIRTIPTDDDFRMDVAALDRQLTDDRRHGVQSIAAVATAGTTNTGAIDDLDAIAAVCRRHDVWLHVDAAYGGPAILTAAYADRLRGIAAADSVAVDPHKWLFVPVEAGLVFVRDADQMRSAFSLVPPYLRSAAGVGGLPWFSEYGFQQTRGFRALKVWMTMKQAGVSGLAAAIDENLALARYLTDCVASAADLELMAPPSLSVVCFRLLNSTLADQTAIDSFNRAVLERLQLGGEAFLTGTELRGRFVLRACIVNYRSRREDIDRMLTALRHIGAELARM